MKAELDLTFQDVIRDSGMRYHENLAVTFLGEKGYSYGILLDRVESLVNHFEKLGLIPGDKIALLGPNSPDWVVSYFAITYMGAVVVPILPDFNREEVINIVSHSEASAIIVSSQHYKFLEHEKPEGLKRIISLDDFSIYNNDEQDLTFTIGLKPEKKYTVNPTDLAAIIYTSGTTGSSKGVMLSHRNIISNALMGKKIKHVDHRDRLLSILPLSHTLENTVGLVIPIMSGSSIYYLRKPPTAPVLLPALKEVKPTIMLTVPLIMEKIFYNKIKPSFTGNGVIRSIYKFPPIRKILHWLAGKKLMETFGGHMAFFGIGGAKVNPEVEQFMLEARFPYAIGYGLTESSPLIAGVMHPNCRLGSTGPAAEGVEIKLHNPDPVTGEGEVWARGSNIMSGYYKEPKVTAEVLTSDGWLKTGDLAVMDKKGYLFIKGRSKNVIIGSSGENIYPEEIESVINTFKHVAESLVLDKGGKLVAMVHINREELEEMYNHLKEEMTRAVEEKVDEIIKELKYQVNQRLNKFSRIHRFELQPVPFQRTPTKKIKRYLYL